MYDTYLSKVPDFLCLDVLRIDVLRLLKVLHTVTTLLDRDEWSVYQ